MKPFSIGPDELEANQIPRDDEAGQTLEAPAQFRAGADIGVVSLDGHCKHETPRL